MNRKFTLAALFLLAGSASFVSCMKDNDFDPLNQWNKEVAAIDKHLTENNIDAIKDSRGIRMVITQMGTGLPASIFNKVDVDYVGKFFSTGATFDDGNVKELLTSLIEGWQVAFTSLPVGTKATIFIPSYYGYGDKQQGTIPPNSTLVFDVTFNSVVLSSTEISRFNGDTTAIDTYLEQKTITATKDPSGLRYVITAPGTGNLPSIYTPVKLNYTVRDISNDANIIATVDGVPGQNFDSRPVDYIKGMLAGLTKIGAGGKITLYIPSGLAFGTAGVNTNGTVLIAPNANLIVDVEFIEVLN